MSDENWKAQREGPRFTVDWRVRLRCADWNAAQRVAAANVGRGGFFIATSKPPLVGSRVELTIDLPDGMTLKVTGTCVHTRSPEQALTLGKSPGFGIKVDDAFRADLVLLEEMARAATAPAPSPPASAKTGPGASGAAADADFDEAKTPARPGRGAAAGGDGLAMFPPGVLTARDEPAPVARLGRATDIRERVDAGVRSPEEVEEREPAPWPEGAGRRAAARPAEEGPTPPPAATASPKADAARGPAAPEAAGRPAAAFAASGAFADAFRDAASGAPQRPTEGPRPEGPRPKRPAAPSGKAEAPPIGIDFGTTYTRVAVWSSNGVALIEDDEGRALMPSIASYPDEGGCVVGWPAREYLVYQPQRTIASAKRLLGRTADHHEIQGLLATSAFRTQTGPGGQIVFQIGEQPLAVPQVCAAIIREALLAAERRLEARVKKAVFTVPVTFAEEQKAALKRAAMLAGVEVTAFVEEPVAGALAYGVGGGVNDIVAVYDFGGGTFDFTLLDVSSQSFRVLASRGDAWLGGDDFDLALAQWAADQFWRQTKVELRQRVVEWQRLLMACEAAKVRLSGSESTVVEERNILRRMDLRIPVDRAQAHELWQELVGRSIDVCREALAAAALEPRDVGAVVLTGGTTHMPFVREAVSRFFERDLEAAVSPDIAVAQGAAIQAARLAGVLAG